MPDFLLYALLAGLGVAIIAGPLGSFVVWQRMAYFGDTLAHSALLGIALGLLLSIDLILAIIVCCISIALILTLLQIQKIAANDTLLGILSHCALAIGLILVAVFNVALLDLNAYLLGDLLAADRRDVITIYIVGSIIMLCICYFWRPLLTTCVNRELAAVEGVAVKWMNLLLTLLLALTIAISMKIVGVLLITALLIIPAATSGNLARSPEKMAILASIFGCVAVLSGLFSSILWNTPAGPSIVTAAGMLFTLSLLVRKACWQES